MVVTIPLDILPVIDYFDEDKLIAWNFFRKLKLYFNIAHTENNLSVDDILFFGGKEASERWETLKEQVKKPNDLEKVFDAFAYSFKKSSSHWQSRDKYLSTGFPLALEKMREVFPVREKLGF